MGKHGGPKGPHGSGNFGTGGPLYFLVFVVIASAVLLTVLTRLDIL